ncbi:MAG: protein YgfX [Herbaspirillum sp.]
MSIATYAIVEPSRTLLVLVGLMCVAVLGVGVAIGFGQVGRVHDLVRGAVGLGCVCLSTATWFWYCRRRLVFYLYVSAAGQIRFTAQRLSDRKLLLQADAVPVQPVAETEVELMATSTIWPWLLLLRLKADNDKIATVVILPDSVTSASFRELAVCCRWLAAHKHSLKF